MSRSAYARPELVDRGSAVERTLQDKDFVRFEKDLLTPSDAMAI